MDFLDLITNNNNGDNEILSKKDAGYYNFTGTQELNRLSSFSNQYPVCSMPAISTTRRKCFSFGKGNSVIRVNRTLINTTFWAFLTCTICHCQKIIVQLQWKVCSQNFNTDELTIFTLSNDVNTSTLRKPCSTFA